MVVLLLPDIKQQAMLVLLLDTLDKQFNLVFTMQTKQTVTTIMVLLTIVKTHQIQYIQVGIVEIILEHLLKVVVKFLLHKVMRTDIIMLDVLVLVQLVLVFLEVGIGEECIFQMTMIE